MTATLARMEEAARNKKMATFANVPLGHMDCTVNTLLSPVKIYHVSMVAPACRKTMGPVMYVSVLQGLLAPTVRRKHPHAIVQMQMIVSTVVKKNIVVANLASLVQIARITLTTVRSSGV